MNYDVLIIGGSYAGLSAALVLGRSLRKVLVLDGGQPANRQTPHGHGFLTRDGETPSELARIAREQVRAYASVQLQTATVVSVGRQADQFEITTNQGITARGRKVLLATGLVDILPDLPGFAECWGRSVLHCPYCHGYEVRNQPVGVLANGDLGYEMATLIQHWNPGLTLFTDGPATLTDNQYQTLRGLGIRVAETPVKAIVHQGGYLTALQLVDHSPVPLTALYSRVPVRQSFTLTEQLGCSLTEQGLIQTTEFGETTVPGVFAAGDATTLMRQVAIAVAVGSKAGAWLNRELVAEDLRNRQQRQALIQDGGRLKKEPWWPV